MWNIHGKKYDFTLFMDRHPGGKFILERTRDLPDITALFESYHAFSDMSKIEETMKKYEIQANVDSTVTTTTAPIPLDFTSYRELAQRVKQQFSTHADIKKANSIWILYNSFTFILALFTFYGCYLSQLDSFYKFLCQMIYSLCESSIQFNLLHEGSHFAISVSPEINRQISTFAHRLIMWNINAWFYHHIYYHHSYTGLENDPDEKLYCSFRTWGTSDKLDMEILNTLEVSDSHDLTDMYIRFLLFPSWFFRKITFVNLFYLVFPGQQTGLGFLYFLIPFTGKYHYADEPFPKIQYYDILDVLWFGFKLYVIYRAGWIQGVLHFSIVNFLYYVNIFPNHSTYESKIENKYTGKDWAIMQISNSGNFLTDYRIWTCMFGGINYQIEHHLFPNMCSIHYPHVSQIVQKYCKEKNIPYSNKPTLWEAYLSFRKYVYSGK